LPKRKITAALAILAGLAGCSSQSIDDYVAETPKLDLRAYLNGPLTASGIFFDHAGRADLRFVVEMHGSWEGDTGTLAETFKYSDGRTDERVWTIRFKDNERFIATAHDVVDEAKGMQRGNAAMMEYKLKLPRDGEEIVVSMEDWLYLQEDGTLINRTEMRKFGLKIGELVVSFRKLPG